MSTPEDDEIDELLDKCSDSENSGESAYPGMTYEQGIEDGINWVQGNEDECPL